MGKMNTAITAERKSVELQQVESRRMTLNLCADILLIPIPPSDLLFHSWTWEGATGQNPNLPMFGESGFGGLSTDDKQNAAAGPSLTQVDGEETDADVSRTAVHRHIRLTASSCNYPRQMVKCTCVFRSGSSWMDFLSSAT
jgi:hypothetical protein